jgi:hypothetical protein
MQNYQIINDIVEAIKYKYVISFDYKEPNEITKSLRIGYPHAVYTHITTRNILLDLYQIDGQSSNLRKLPAWRQFDIENISNIVISKDRTFSVQQGYNPNSRNYLNIIAKI